MKFSEFDSKRDVPDLAGKVILITGGTAGLGAATARALAQHNPTRIYITGRNAAAATALISGIRAATPSADVRFLAADLTSLASVAACADAVLKEETRLDVLVLNAGIMTVPPGLTQDGFEIQFGVNHLGQALLFRKLAPLLVAAAKTPSAGGREGKGDARVVVLSSLGYRGYWWGKGIDFATLRTEQRFWLMGSYFRYGQSKLANVLYAREIARRFGGEGVSAVSLHPGVIHTGLVTNQPRVKRWFIGLTTESVGEEDGAKNQVWCATAGREQIESGGYYMPVGVNMTKKLYGKAKDDTLAERLWQWTEEQIKRYL